MIHATRTTRSRSKPCSTSFAIMIRMRMCLGLLKSADLHRPMYLLVVRARACADFLVCRITAFTLSWFARAALAWEMVCRFRVCFGSFSVFSEPGLSPAAQAAIVICVLAVAGYFGGGFIYHYRKGKRGMCLMLLLCHPCNFTFRPRSVASP